MHAIIHRLLISQVRDYILSHEKNEVICEVIFCDRLKELMEIVKDMSISCIQFMFISSS